VRGGVAGFAKASVVAIANPDAVVLLVAVELMLLTFLRNELQQEQLMDQVSLPTESRPASLPTQPCNRTKKRR